MNESNDRTHLFRGSPSVRNWSKYQETVTEWTLCGINRRIGEGANRRRHPCTEDASLVSCPYCLELMRPSLQDRPKTAKPGNLWK